MKIWFFFSFCNNICALYVNIMPNKSCTCTCFLKRTRISRIHLIYHLNLQVHSKLTPNYLQLYTMTRHTNTTQRASTIRTITRHMSHSPVTSQRTTVQPPLTSIAPVPSTIPAATTRLVHQPCPLSRPHSSPTMNILRSSQRMTPNLLTRVRSCAEKANEVRSTIFVLCEYV